jgi:hypothetical protein
MEKNNSNSKIHDLLIEMKRYLKIEHQDNDNELLRYLRKQAGLHQDEKY